MVPCSLPCGSVDAPGHALCETRRWAWYEYWIHLQLERRTRHNCGTGVSYPSQGKTYIDNMLISGIFCMCSVQLYIDIWPAIKTHNTFTNTNTKLARVVLIKAENINDTNILFHKPCICFCRGVRCGASFRALTALHCSYASVCLATSRNSFSCLLQVSISNSVSCARQVSVSQ